MGAVFGGESKKEEETLTKKGSKLKRRLIRLIIGLVVLSVFPYFLPLTTEAGRPEPPFAESRFVQVQGIDLHYRLWPPETNTPRGKVLMIHGLGGSTYSWRYVTDALIKAGYAVAAADLPGFGYSSRRTGLDHSQENRAQWMWQLAEILNEELPEPVREQDWILMGHSMGGGTVGAMTAQAPERTEAVIFVDGVLTLSAQRGRVLLAYPPAVRWVQAALRYVLIRPRFIFGMLKSAYGRDPSEEEVAAHYNPLRLPGTERVFQDLFRSQRAIDLDALGNTEVPMLAIWGSEDMWVPFMGEEQLTGLLPDISLQVIADAAHCPMETHPIEFNRSLLNFLAGIY